MRNFMAALATMSIGLLVAGGTTACATKKYVRTSVGEVNDKVDSLGRSVEQTQERTRQNEAKIAEVDTKAQNAANSAQQASGAAATAQNSANAASNAGRSGRHEARRVRQGVAPARARSGAQRELRWLRVRQEGSARVGQAADRSDGVPAQTGPQERVHRNRGAHRQHRVRGVQREARARARARRCSAICTRSTRCRCTRST